MSFHKGSVVAQGNEAPASNRKADSIELTEMGPLLEEKAEEEQTCPVTQEEEEVWVWTLPLQGHNAMEKMEELIYKVWEGRLGVILYVVLHDWLKDNDYLLHSHRPPLPFFQAYFKSIICIHRETANIWTHLLATAYLHFHHLCPGYFHHHRGIVGPFCHP
uniref:Uncharacterized protein n=1 Tax=Oryctolagus cuniculus TaxID=9986 RepID=G1TU77_RABIT